MGHITVSVEIDAPVEAVFAYVDDYRNTTKYMKDLLRWDPVGDKNHGKGAKFELAKKAGPKTLTGVVEITSWVENKTIAWISREGLYQKGSWSFSHKAGVTTATYDMEYDFGGGIAGKVLAKVAEPIVRSDIEKSVEQMGAIVEKQAAKAAKAAPTKASAARPKVPAKR